MKKRQSSLFTNIDEAVTTFIRDIVLKDLASAGDLISKYDEAFETYYSFTRQAFHRIVDDSQVR